MSATHSTTTQKVMDTVKGIATSVMVDIGMEELRDRFKNRIVGFAEKGKVEHRVEMFYAVLVQFANKYGKAKRDTILRRWAMRQRQLPRNYGTQEPYGPLSEYEMVAIYTDNKHFLQEPEIGEDYLAWLDEMASMSDEEHDLVLEAYEDDKWDRLGIRAAEILLPVEQAMATIPGYHSPDIFRGRAANGIVQVIIFAVIAAIVLFALS